MVDFAFVSAKAYDPDRLQQRSLIYLAWKKSPRSCDTFFTVRIHTNQEICCIAASRVMAGGFEMPRVHDIVQSGYTSEMLRGAMTEAFDVQDAKRPESGAEMVATPNP